jgi:hypothetical protein
MIYELQSLAYHGSDRQTSHFCHQNGKRFFSSRYLPYDRHADHKSGYPIRILDAQSHRVPPLPSAIHSTLEGSQIENDYHIIWLWPDTLL